MRQAACIPLVTARWYVTSFTGEVLRPAVNLSCPAGSGDKRDPSFMLAAVAILLLGFALSHNGDFRVTGLTGGGRKGEGERNKGEVEVVIDLLDSLAYQTRGCGARIPYCNFWLIETKRSFLGTGRNCRCVAHFEWS